MSSEKFKGHLEAKRQIVEYIDVLIDIEQSARNVTEREYFIRRLEIIRNHIRNNILYKEEK